jgi:hypothetical protein
MMIVRALPTLVLTRALRPLLPDDHPWRHRRFTLTNWSEHQTALCRGFDNLFWLWLIGATVLGIVIGVRAWVGF